MEIIQDSPHPSQNLWSSHTTMQISTVDCENCDTHRRKHLNPVVREDFSLEIIKYLFLLSQISYLKKNLSAVR